LNFLVLIYQYLQGQASYNLFQLTLSYSVTIVLIFHIILEEGTYRDQVMFRFIQKPNYYKYLKGVK
jgi:hypothetical protein